MFLDGEAIFSGEVARATGAPTNHLWEDSEVHYRGVLISEIPLMGPFRTFCLRTWSFVECVLEQGFPLSVIASFVFCVLDYPVHFE